MILTKTYSAKEIHAAIVAKNVAMITEVIELQKKDRVSAPAVVSSEYDRLCKLGLANTKNAQILKTKIDEVGAINEGIDSYNAAIDRQKEFCAFIKEMLEVFGHNTLLVRFDDFEQIIRKYNLACGRLEDYTGIIPEKNLAELESAKQKLVKAKDYKSRVTYREFSKTNFCDSALFIPHFIDSHINNNIEYVYPFLNEHIHELIKVEEIDPEYVDESKIESYKIFPFIKSKEYLSTGITEMFRQRQTGVKVDDKGSTNLFIVAPYKDIKNGVRLRRFVKAEDPFICSYTTFGIMIHTAWGEEAEDEVLDKYHKMINLLEE